MLGLTPPICTRIPADAQRQQAPGTSLSKRRVQEKGKDLLESGFFVGTRAGDGGAAGAGQPYNTAVTAQILVAALSRLPMADQEAALAARPGARLDSDIVDSLAAALADMHGGSGGGQYSQATQARHALLAGVQAARAQAAGGRGGGALHDPLAIPAAGGAPCARFDDVNRSHRTH